jgi:hypothetical protein
MQPELLQFASKSNTALKYEGESDSPKSLWQEAFCHSTDVQSSFEMAWKRTLSTKSLCLEAGINEETVHEKTYYFYSKFIIIRKNKITLSLQQAVAAHKIVRRRGSHIFQTIGSQMVVKFQLYSPAGLYHKKIPSIHFC